MFTLTILSFGCSATSAFSILGDKSLSKSRHRRFGCPKIVSIFNGSMIIVIGSGTGDDTSLAKTN